jgi:hypothetical protein
MFSGSQTTFQRRPALIPPDLHLSSEDERSILLRIGNLHLASLGSQAYSSHDDSSHDLSTSIKGAVQRPLIDAATFAEPTAPTTGTKRKASTTAEQYHELSCAVEEKLTSKSCQLNHHKTGIRGSSHAALPDDTRGRNHISTTRKPSFGAEGQSSSPKDRAGIALYDSFFLSR